MLWVVLVDYVGNLFQSSTCWICVWCSGAIASINIKFGVNLYKYGPAKGHNIGQNQTDRQCTYKHGRKQKQQLKWTLTAVVFVF